MQGKSERNRVATGRKVATLLLPTSYDGLHVVVCKRVGHIQPVCAVVRAGIAIGSPRQAAPIVFDGGEERSEARGEVFLHAPIIPAGAGIASVETEKHEETRET